MDEPLTPQNYPPGVSSVVTVGNNEFTNIQPILETEKGASQNTSEHSGPSYAGSWIGAAINFVGDLITNYQQNEYNKDQFERETQAAIDAEKRANAEYDRRQADARAYNDAWDERLLAKGYSPFAALSKGQGVTSTTASAPSTTQMPRGIPKQAPMGAISNALQVYSQLEALKNLEAQTRKTNAEANVVEKEDQGFWERFHAEMDGVLANTRNTTAKAAIAESQFIVQVATESAQIEEAFSAAHKMYYQMKAAAYEPEFANARLAELYIEIETAALRQQIVANEAVMSSNDLVVQDMQLADIAAYYESRAENDVAAREALAEIQTIESNASLMRKSDNWFNANQWKDLAKDVVAAGADLYSRGKSASLGRLTHTSTIKRSLGDGDYATDTYHHYSK